MPDNIQQPKTCALDGETHTRQLSGSLASTEAMSQTDDAELSSFSGCSLSSSPISTTAAPTEWIRQVSAVSAATSGMRFSEPSQTLLFLDWDDTLFPTSDIFREELHLYRGSSAGFEESETDDDDSSAVLERWRASLKRFLETAVSVSDRCVIVTNSVRPWVTKSLRIFAPELLPLFERADGNGLHVVYAIEFMEEQRWSRCLSAASCCFNGMEDWIRQKLGIRTARASCAKDLTSSKHMVMQREAQAFYAQYPGQTWKNIISFGDMCFEHDALMKLSSDRAKCCSRERLRTKAVTLPEALTISSLADYLAVTAMLLPAYVAHDGDIDLDLRTAAQPLEHVGKALRIPKLAEVKFIPNRLRHVEHEGVPDEVLDELACLVHENCVLGG
mmetsp:Transcript_23744/g.55340  ORF Transcript_23744/g.55340 Transcript_23744/m.55340 type:complete len:388 (+) Transcript_23744:80-1243(+)